MRGVLNSLVAAAEIEETEVKWQPLEHSVSFGSLDEFGEVNWIVVGDQKLVVEKSRSADQNFTALAMRLAAADGSSGTMFDQVESTSRLLILYQRLTAPNPISLNRELDEFESAACCGFSAGD